MKKDRSRFSTLSGFLDTVFNLAIGFAFIAIVSFILINIVKVKIPPTVNREGAFVVELIWDTGVNVDIDLWVRAPNDEKVGFNSRDSDTMSSLRDDLGNTNDYTVDSSGAQKLNPLNREEITIRTTMVGEYIVNAHYYGNAGFYTHPITLTAKLKETISGLILLERTMVIEKKGDEVTLFTFFIDRNEKLTKSSMPDRPIKWVVKK